MIKQTISLFRYLMLGILNLRLFVLVLILVIGAILLSSFIAELAIINSRQIATAVLADFLLYFWHCYWSLLAWPTILNLNNSSGF